MKLRDYFLLGLQHGLGKKRHWMTRLFNVCYTWNDNPHYPRHLVKEAEDKVFFVDPDTKERHYLEDWIPDRAPLHFRDAFELTPGLIANYRGKETKITTYGNVFFNQLCLIEPFGTLFEFPFGYCSPKIVEAEVEERLISNRPDGDRTTKAPEGKFHVWQYLMFIDHCLAMPAYADGLVTSVTRKSMTSSPERNAIRAEQTEKYKDHLTDPVYIAKIGQTYKAADDQYLEGDESQEFYTASAKTARTRMKVFYHFGGESPFSDGTSVEYIAKSLEEGIDTQKMVAMNNSLRFGSYNRGAQTALGGESTKTIYRMVGTARIIEPDCGTTMGIPTQVRSFVKAGLLGYTYIQQGVSILITKDNIDSLVGKKIDIRGPMACKAGQGKGKNICAVCAGRAVAENPNGIPAAAAGVGGRFLSLFLSKMHATVLRTVRMDLAARIT
jgi:hypothetical protein